MTNSKARVVALMFAVGLAMLPSLVTGIVSADSTQTVAPVLPTGRYGTSAVWDGSNVYVFGGIAGPSTYFDQVVRYNPGTGAVTTMTAKLPTGRMGTSAVWDGSYAYIFGGRDSTSYLSQILRYDPAADSITVMTGTVPTARWLTSAVWDGSNAYIFGGLACCVMVMDEIVRYNPATDTVTTVTTALPTARWGTSAAWDGSNAYIFGGEDGSSDLNEIVQYNPGTNTAMTMTATLPTARYHTSAVWDGSNAFIFGGENDSSNLNEIVRYSPGTNTVTTMAATLPTERDYTSAVWDGSNAFIFGGIAKIENGWGVVDHIVRYNLAPGVPQGITAVPGPGAGEIRLTWQPPSPNTHSSAITNYDIYRGNTAGSETFLTQVGNVLTYTDSALGNGATRYYRVAAVSVAGEGPASEEANATTFITPTAPQDLTALAGTGPGEVFLTWQAPAGDGGLPITNYRIYRGTSSGGEVLLTQVGNVLTYSDFGRALGNVYFYKVSAVNAAGEGLSSNEAFAPGTQPFGDNDGDFVPDSIEDDLCAQENPNFNFEGTCVGNDYSPPTVAGIVEDIEKFLP